MNDKDTALRAALERIANTEWGNGFSTILTMQELARAALAQATGGDGEARTAEIEKLADDTWRMTIREGRSVTDIYEGGLAAMFRWALRFGRAVQIPSLSTPAPDAGQGLTDFRLNLARALFEASYGYRLCAWSDQTESFWLARADDILLDAPTAPDAGQVEAVASDDEGPIADAARRIASWTEGQARIHVYRAAKRELAGAHLSASPARAEDDSAEVNRLAQELDQNPATIRRALASLRDRGLVEPAPPPAAPDAGMEQAP